MTDARTLAALHRVPPEQFTAIGNRGAAELRRAGQDSAAASIARLPRPTLEVRAINQAAQQGRAAVDRLLSTADELKRTQLGRAPTGVSGSSEPRNVRKTKGAFLEARRSSILALGRSGPLRRGACPVVERSLP